MESEFSKRLGSLITQSGETLSEISSKTGIATGSLSKYQNDEAQASVAKLLVLADYFEVSADWLLGITDTKTRNESVQDVCWITGLSEDAVNVLIGAVKSGSGRIPEFISVMLEYKEFSSIMGGFYDYIDALLSIKQYLINDGQHPIDFELQRHFHLDEETKKTDVAEYRFSKECVRFLHEWTSKRPITIKQGDENNGKA